MGTSSSTLVNISISSICQISSNFKNFKKLKLIKIRILQIKFNYCLQDIYMILEDMRIQAYVVISRYSRTEKFKGVFIKNLRPEKNNSKQICYCHQFENQILHRNFIGILLENMPYCYYLYQE